MGRKKLHESLKIKEDDRFPSRVSGYCNWESIRFIKAILSHKQLDMFRVTCFGYFLDGLPLEIRVNHHRTSPNTRIKRSSDPTFEMMTLVGKDDRNAIMYWALQSVDDLNAFNSFPWGTLLYVRTFDSLSNCVVGRDDKYKEHLESSAKQKAEKYNVYGFVTAFQVWEIEAIPKWAILGYESRTCHNMDTDVINFKITTYTLNHLHFTRVIPSPEMSKGNSKPSDNLKQLSRPPKITIKVTRDRKRLAYSINTYIDPTAKQPRKPKMPEFRRDSMLDEDVLLSMNSWINDNNKNTSEREWKSLGSIVVDLKEWVITVYDSLSEINSVLEITKWTYCLRKMLPSLLVHTLLDIYNNVLLFAIQRPEKDIPNQGNGPDCGIFSLKFLEYLSAGKPFNFEAKDGPALRVKIATEILKNSKQVPCNNIVEGIENGMA
ncbi:hypothetical protein Ddye_010952 [Dipteronia dyeriana]|uniref:Ubiquitin-like protease family profile domain-containing protein n=1 Tax=Dipteronia dyeriana TaxID=168575 RepID=A0AAD9XE84_9ROSI|nr:hypothetical protein Ddye_010952 [Dipteronia dyeriana]